MFLTKTFIFFKFPLGLNNATGFSEVKNERN